MTLPRGNILGVHVSAVDMPQAVNTVDSWIGRRGREYVCVIAAHVVMDGFRNPDIRGYINRAGLAVPDGMGIVWLLKSKGYRRVSRVYGADLLLALCEHGLAKQWRHFFYGGEPGTAGLLAARLADRFPGLRVAGAVSPPFRDLTPAEDEAFVHQIGEAHPDILWTGISSLKQIRWMGAHIEKIRVPVMIGIGAAFDFLSGRKKQAPRWIQRSGLEWLFRLALEPGRLGKRYAQYPLFFLLAAAQSLGLKRYD
jgi:N-acetylglucosaminyldiphosphoundecaprenol N-acetyl-beta-D-mannosaminyltransferase